MFGTTRSEARAEELARAGIEPVVVDVFDRTALSPRAVLAARPEVVIHQLTDLPPALDPAQMAAAVARNARIRDEGTRNLVDAAGLQARTDWWRRASPGLTRRGGSRTTKGIRSIFGAEGSRSAQCPRRGGARELGPERVASRWGRASLRAALRSRTGFDAPAGSAPLHVDAAAHAALLAVEKGAPGVYNVADPGTYVSSEKVRRELGWAPGFRLSYQALALNS